MLSFKNRRHLKLLYVLEWIKRSGWSLNYIRMK